MKYFFCKVRGQLRVNSEVKWAILDLKHEHNIQFLVFLFIIQSIQLSYMFYVCMWYTMYLEINLFLMKIICDKSTFSYFNTYFRPEILKKTLFVNSDCGPINDEFCISYGKFQ